MRFFKGGNFGIGNFVETFTNEIFDFIGPGQVVIDFVLNTQKSDIFFRFEKFSNLFLSMIESIVEIDVTRSGANCNAWLEIKLLTLVH